MSTTSSHLLPKVESSRLPPLPADRSPFRRFRTPVRTRTCWNLLLSYSHAIPEAFPNRKPLCMFFLNSWHEYMCVSTIPAASPQPHPGTGHCESNDDSPCIHRVSRPPPRISQETTRAIWDHRQNRLVPAHHNNKRFLIRRRARRDFH